MVARPATVYESSEIFLVVTVADTEGNTPFVHDFVGAVPIQGILIPILGGFLELVIEQGPRIHADETISRYERAGFRVKHRDYCRQAYREECEEIKFIMVIAGARDEFERTVKLRDKAEFLLNGFPLQVASRVEQSEERFTCVGAGQNLIFLAESGDRFEGAARQGPVQLQVDPVRIDLMSFVHLDVVVMRNQRAENIALAGRLDTRKAQ